MWNTADRHRNGVLLVIVALLALFLLASSLQRTTQEEGSGAADLSLTATPMSTPTPTSLYLPAPTNVHIRGETRLCWDYDASAPFYDYRPKEERAIGVAVPSTKPAVRCHDFTNLGNDVEELCVSVNDGLRASPWACKRLDAPTVTPPNTNPPPIDMTIERSSHGMGIDATLCWDRPEGAGNPEGYIGNEGPIPSITFSKTTTQDCLHFLMVEPAAKVCVVISIHSTRTIVCQVVPIPPSPNETPPPTAMPNEG